MTPPFGQTAKKQWFSPPPRRSRDSPSPHWLDPGATPAPRDRWMMADLLFMEQPPKKDGKVIGDSLLSIDDINLVYYHLWYQFSVLSPMYHHLWNIFRDYIYQYIIDSSNLFHRFLLFYLVLKGKRFEIGTCGGKTTQSMDRWFQVWRPRTGGVYSWDTQLSKGSFLLVAMYSTRFVGCRSFIWIHTYIYIYIYKLYIMNIKSTLFS